MADTSNHTEAELTPLKRAFLAIESLQERLRDAQRARHEPIAIVGAGCRLPGGVDDLDGLWAVLRDGVDAVSEVPAERWDIDEYYDPDVSAPGKMNTRHGGFLRDVDRFDPQFFGIAPREAASMDPQQRLLLEVAWEALEHAGEAPAALAGSATGVFIGITTGDYAQLTLTTRGIEGLDAYYASGIAHSIASGRLSYVLGLNGPSVSLDTACSSSLLAVHLAVQSLRLGESDLALAGGVNLVLSPEMSITLSKYQMMAPDGRCKFGDARADGFVRGEGCGLVVLKRLSDAQASGDRVLAVIRGSAVSQDGASSGLTAPNGPAQTAVIRAALADAGVQPGDVTYVEAHGTGTALGDPIEVQALGEVYGSARPDTEPLVAGSVKSNLGHLEAAAGITGLLKLVTMAQHRTIPASLHFDTPSPHIAWDDLGVEVPTVARPWDVAGGRRLAGLSSFGFSGTNVHLVVEEPPEAQALDDVPTTAAPSPRLVPLSGRTDDAVRQLAGRIGDRLSVGDDLDLDDVVRTLASGRNHFAHRVAALAPDVRTLATQLQAHARGETTAGVVAAHADRADPPKVAFVFTGQGAQRCGMARQLYEQAAVFRAELDRCAEVLDPLLIETGGVGLLDVIFAEAGTAEAALLDRTAFTQPALVAVEWALTALWSSWGVTPSLVLGHSVGEITAAIVAGVLTLEDGLALVATRGRLMDALPAGGAMAAVFADRRAVESAIAAVAPGLSVAADNGPQHTVVSGSLDHVSALVAHFETAGVRTQRLTVSHAFHSQLLDPMLDDLEVAVSKIALRPPSVRLISNLSGTSAGPEIAEPAYWRRHAREAVRFREGLDQLDRLGCDVIIEIGPHPVLLGMAQTVLPAGRVLALPSLRKGRDDMQQILESLGALYCAGAAIDWPGVAGPERRGTPVALPTYPFQRERHWMAHSRHATPRRVGEHPVLGRQLRSALSQVQFEKELAVDDIDYLDDHRVFDVAVLPATAYIEAALAAGAAAPGSTAVAVLRDVEILAALVVGDDESVVVQTIITPGHDHARFEILSQSDGTDSWHRHAAGTIGGGDAEVPSTIDLAVLRARCTEHVGHDQHYAHLRERGLAFGSSLRGVRDVWRGDGEVLGAIELVARDGDYLIHPALLDGCLQVLAWLARDTEATYLPIAIDEVAVHRGAGRSVWAHATLRSGASGTQNNGETITGDVTVIDDAGHPIATVRGITLKRVDRDALKALGRARLGEWLYELEWRRQPLAGARRSLAAAELPSPAELVGAIAAPDAALCDEVAHHQRLFDALGELSGRYVMAALADLGVQLTAGTTFAANELPVAPAHQRLLDRLLGSLAGDGVLTPAGASWTLARSIDRATIDLATLDTAIDRLEADHPSGRGELAIVRRCGASLADALRGDADPLQLLFPGGSAESAEQMYHDSPFARLYNSLAADTLAAAAGAVPQGRPLRIIEIGAGTGGTTGHLVPRLADAAAKGTMIEYTFTDISPLFVARARERFAEPFMRFSTLDVEADPIEHGFPSHGYDVVVATNVLHATADLRRTFHHVAELLAPGGRLVMLEMTKPQRFIDISFGLTPGWWRVEDDVREDYLLLDRQQWDRFLTDAGFGAIAAAPPVDSVPGADLSVQTLVVASAPTVAAESVDEGRAWLVLADSAGIGAGLAAELAGAGDHAVVVMAEVAEDLAAIVARSPAGGWHGVVHLWSLDPARDSLSSTQEHRVGSALALTQALVGAGSAARLWLVTAGAQALPGSAPDPAQAALWGLGRTIALEHPELHCSMVDIDPSAPDAITTLVAELTNTEPEPSEGQIALRVDGRHVARLVRAPHAATAASTPERAVQLALAPSGALDEMMLRPVSRRTPGPGEVEIAVHAAGLNFRDVMNALAMREDREPVGSECSGIVVAVGEGVTTLSVGDAVVAVAPGCFGTYVTTSAELVAPKPVSLSFEQAATIPLAFLTAHVALHDQAHIAAGDIVLVHAAAGGVGLAAVQLALRAGATVLGTAGSDRKRAHVLAQGAVAAMDSRSTEFADEILARTGGRGVDVVLNSLTGDLIGRSLDVLADGGRFVELGKREVWSPAEVAARKAGVTYSTGPLADDLLERPWVVGPLLRRIVAEVGTGQLQPLPVQSFRLDDAAAAFRYMSQARHIGKIVITRPEATANAAGPSPLVRDDGTYLVTGGLGGLGLLVAEWLVGRGARHLALMGRGEPSPEATEAISRMRQIGADVLVARGDVSCRSDVAGVLDTISGQMRPLRGVLHAAGVLDDGAIVRQDWSRFVTVLAPKVEGTWNLHELTLEYALDHFVLFSSAASLFGSPGQANHAAANSFLDALAAWRREHGLPGLSINWGAWAGTGSVVTHGVSDRIATQGIVTMPPDQGIEALAALMAQGRPQVAVVALDWPVFLRQFGAAGIPRWLDDVVRDGPRTTGTPAATRAPVASVRDRIASVAADQRPQVVLDFVAGQVARVLGVTSAADISERQPLNELGLDSLMAVELRNVLGEGLALERALPATLVFDHPTVEALAAYLTRTVLSDLVSSADDDVRGEASDPRADANVDANDDLLSAIESMSDDDVARILGE